MNILEKDIEELLFDAIVYDWEAVKEKGLPLIENGQYYRQQDLGPYGRADIIGVWIGDKKAGKRVVAIHVIELKKEKIDFGSLNQALGYDKAIRAIIGTKLKGCVFESHFSLIGKSIDTTGNFCFIPDSIKNVSLYKYELDFYKGLRFRECRGYCLTNAAFPNTDFISDRSMNIAGQRDILNFYRKREDAIANRQEEHY